MGEPRLCYEIIENLYIQKKQKFFRIAYSIVSNKEDAEDALHEAYALATTNFGKLKDINFFETWFYRILINTCRQVLKKRKAYCENTQENIGVSDVHFNNIENKVYLEELIKPLNIEQKQVLILKYVEGHSIKEISGILDIPKGTVKSRLFNAIDKVRERLKRKESYL